MRPNLLLLIFFLAAFALQSCTQQETKSQKPPNIVFILADDLGYGDISALNPESKIKTPELDKLASAGIRFSDAHSNSSVCTPTRYGILTGQYCWRSRMKKGVLLGYSPSLIEENTQTVAKFLQKQGYTTACIGKWHLGVDFRLKDGTYIEGKPGVDFDRKLIGFNDYKKIDFSAPAKGGPKGAGFDYSYILPASLDFEPYMYLENNLAVEAPTDSTPGNDLNADPWATGAFWRKGQMAPSFSFEGVLPTFTNKASDFLAQQKKAEKPFFLYFPMNAPHTPWVPTDEFKNSSPVGQYGDFVQMVDAEVGKILASLKENGLEENTLVVFTSDNGAYWRPELIERFGHRSNVDFRGMKADIWEGGHHIPFFVKWPGVVNAGSISDETISLTDFFATVQDLFTDKGTKPKDSFSVLPVLKAEQTEIDRAPVIHHSGSGKFAIRSGKWKLIEGLGSGGFTEPKFPEPKEGEPVGQLYDMVNDLQETNNVYLSEPKVVKELTEKLESMRGY
ncbi:sulfatase family protein [Draconibacterium halophilum]|uniref:Arylsulfatase n=1 Tax=Draconibacterium halophilum TaxID=2706887 RepID=A0A6C0RHH2_9BACT|nr:arylsulfatase [Draconibacterium halophilum]QIA09497.1 arylsulfatase [Draconibacterium halophilum]